MVLQYHMIIAIGVRVGPGVGGGALHEKHARDVINMKWFMPCCDKLSITHLEMCDLYGTCA
jgi:hypothetical protein